MNETKFSTMKSPFHLYQINNYNEGKENWREERGPMLKESHSLRLWRVLKNNRAFIVVKYHYFHFKDSGNPSIKELI